MIDSEITLRKLEIFLAFMEKENISRAAESLGLSSVSVHRALHTLEEGFRCPLFVHKGRNLLPLPAAHTLAEYAHDLRNWHKRGSRKLDSRRFWSAADENRHDVFTHAGNHP